MTELPTIRAVVTHAAERRHRRRRVRAAGSSLAMASLVLLVVAITSGWWTTADSEIPAAAPPPPIPVTTPTPPAATGGTRLRAKRVTLDRARTSPDAIQAAGDSGTLIGAWSLEGATENVYLVELPATQALPFVQWCLNVPSIGDNPSPGRSRSCSDATSARAEPSTSFFGSLRVTLTPGNPPTLKAWRTP